MPSYFQNKQGQWVLEWKVYSGIRSTEKRIVSKKKSAIPNKLRLAVDNLEQGTKTGVATNAEIDQWVEGFADRGAKKPLLSLEDACAIFEGYRDTRRRTGTYIKYSRTENAQSCQLVKLPPKLPLMQKKFF